MKIIVIGRGDDADIRIDDELISRRHATIRMLPMGRMEIRDLSKNGTFVNGIRLAVNKPVRVTRKDVVSFARVSQLDWKEVPDPTRPYRIAAIAVAAIIAALVAFGLISRIGRVAETKPAPAPVENREAGKDSDDGAREKQQQEKAVPKAERDNTVPDWFSDKKKKDKPRKDKEENRDKAKDADSQKEPKEDKKESEPENTFII